MLVWHLLNARHCSKHVNWFFLRTTLPGVTVIPISRVLQMRKWEHRWSGRWLMVKMHLVAQLWFEIGRLAPEPTSYCCTPLPGHVIGAGLTSHTCVLWISVAFLHIHAHPEHEVTWHSIWPHVLNSSGLTDSSPMARIRVYLCYSVQLIVHGVINAGPKIWLHKIYFQTT